MRDLIRAAMTVQTVLDREGWQYCFIGGIAVLKWGQVRLTQDIDVTVFTGVGGEPPVVDRLLELFRARLTDARNFALVNRVLLLRTATGIDLDVSCGAFDFERSVMARARKVQLQPGQRLRLCSAEDLIVYKCFAGRSLDWADVESVVAKQLGRIDWRYVYKHLTPLATLKEEPQIVERLREIQRSVASGDRPTK